MATYVNNLRLKEIATGAESGTWGTSTNTNLELIADALGSGTEAIATNADAHTTTIADGAADEGRALFLKYTGTLDSACTITLAPNTINKVWFIENATSGAQNIIISQGSGDNITIAAGKIAVIFTDGAGSGATVLDALADLELSSTLSVAGASTLTGVTTHGGNVVSDTDSTDDLGTTGVRWANLWVDDVIATTTVKPGTLVLGAGSITDTSGAITFGNENLVTTGTLGSGALTAGAISGTTLSTTGNVTFAGLLGIGSAANAAVALNITSNDMAGTGQYGLNVNPTFTSDATASGYGVRVLAATINESFTQANTYGILIESGYEGSGSTITNLYGLKVENQTSGGTNYAIHTGTGAVSFGDNVGMGTGAGTGHALEVVEDASDTNMGRFKYTATAAPSASKGLNLWNTATGSTTDGGLVFSMSDNGGVERYAGSITVDKVGTWTSTASTRDGQMRFNTAVDGVIAERFRIKQTGVVNFTSNVEMAGDLAVTGAVSKGSGSFKIAHPLPAKTDTHYLVHSFIEGPQADLIYRGVANLSGGSATVDLDEAAGMSAGTWELLCRDPQAWIQNDSGWDAVRGSVEGNTLTIECEEASSSDTVSWMIVAERCDPHMMETGWTDDDGRVIVEPEKESPLGPNGG